MCNLDKIDFLTLDLQIENRVPTFLDRPVNHFQIIKLLRKTFSFIAELPKRYESCYDLRKL